MCRPQAARSVYPLRVFSIHVFFLPLPSPYTVLALGGIFRTLNYRWPGDDDTETRLTLDAKDNRLNSAFLPVSRPLADARIFSTYSRQSHRLYRFYAAEPFRSRHRTYRVNGVFFFFYLVPGHGRPFRDRYNIRFSGRLNLGCSRSTRRVCDCQIGNRPNTLLFGPHGRLKLFARVRSD